MKKRVDPLATYGCLCHLCPFAKNGAPDQPVFAEGPRRTRVAIGGEGPGNEEADRGRPYVGATGQELDDALLKVGLKRAELLIINAMCCKPKPARSLADLKKATDCCRPAFYTQLKERGVEHIFLPGKWAAYAAFGRTFKLKMARGFIRPWTLKDTEEANEKARSRLLAAAERAARRADRVRAGRAAGPRGGPGRR